MKIGIHAQALRRNTAPCGIHTYLTNLIAALSALDQENEFFLFASDEMQVEGRGKNLSTKIGRKRGVFSQFGFSRLFTQYQCDVAFIPKETVPLFIDKPTVITVYDLFFIKMYKQFKHQIKLSSKIHYELAKLVFFKKAAKLCAISEDCKKDLIDICNIDPKKVVVTPLAYNAQCFFPRGEEEICAIKRKYALDLPYFLNISSLFWEGKNVQGVLRAFKRIQEAGFPHTLVMVGRKGPSYPEMQAYIHKHHLKVKCLFSITEKEVAILLAGATALVFPSFHEGFGLPIIEAMATKCPVITSNVSAMPETAGEAALLVDPYQSDELFEAMKTIIENRQLATHLKELGLSRAKKFSWHETARKTLDVISSV